LLKIITLFKHILQISIYLLLFFNIIKNPNNTNSLVVSEKFQLLILFNFDNI